MSHQITISITTVPDIEALRLIHQFGELSDDGVLNAAMHLHHQKNGNKILPLYQQKIVSIAVLQRMNSGKLISVVLGKGATSEAELLHEFAELMKEGACVTSWDMNNFDLPLINSRLLKHGIASADFYKAEKLSLRNCFCNPHKGSVQHDNANDDLTGLSRSLGLPSIDGLTDQECTACYLNNDMQRVHEASQSRAQNSYLIYLRYQLMTAQMTTAEYKAAYTVLSEALSASGAKALK